ncbi:class I SAM-dependent methyltransferase [Nitrogeniibacter mangrovi]|uniref:Class I SAM-dependent methyltransferase n=1 Tax=Nitrogeniibacter mangrovi TaxID=2016596 RepID=A0A6C1B6K5_9RHOO|nr:class I SAM-dependent methyltransferase [Nitrogeniibacter mangrovi]QID19077.1 class I SAM-dependent methyltransferase [Nitrogeniibacter mangrovi]
MRAAIVPVLRLLLAQAAGWLLLFALLRLGAPVTGLPLALVQGTLAAAVAHLLRAERWWLALHLGFTPLIWLASQLAIAPGWYLAAFVVLAVFYWTSFRSRVPLFLSNRRTVDALAALLPRDDVRLLDAGAGTGSALRPLARRFPRAHLTGIETAPGPWLIGRLLCAGQANLRWLRGDFWAHDWAPYDVVYVFLSPVPMPEVWRKACAQMRPGSLLVSNSFAIPGVEPVRTVTPQQTGGRPLYLYEIGAPCTAKSGEKGEKTRSLPATPPRASSP